MKTIQEVNSAIMFGDWTNVELTSKIDAVKWRRATLSKLTKASLAVGDSVQFTSSKNGLVYKGRVRTIAVKFITVNCGIQSWRVPANMLERVEEFA